MTAVRALSILHRASLTRTRPLANLPNRMSEPEPSFEALGFEPPLAGSLDALEERL